MKRLEVRLTLTMIFVVLVAMFMFTSPLVHKNFTKLLLRNSVSPEFLKQVILFKETGKITLDTDLLDNIKQKKLALDFYEIYANGVQQKEKIDLDANQPDDKKAVYSAWELEYKEALTQKKLQILDFYSTYTNAERQAKVLTILVTMLFSVTLAIFLGRGIARPILAVSRAASSLAQGDLSNRIELKPFVHSLSHPASEVVKLANDFNEMANSLECYEGERKAMIADIAHELRTPLGTIKIRFDALKEGLLSFNEHELELLNQQVDLLERLIEDLRTFSLADANQLSLNLLPLDFGELIENLIPAFQEHATKVGINLKLIPLRNPVQIKVDTGRILQVLNNILSNAFKVTPYGGNIEVELSTLGKNVQLSVRDSGPGFNEEDIETLFQRFVQGKHRDIQGKIGSGLGLAIVKTLVSLHGGQVQASNHTKGAEVTIILPCHA